MTSDVLTSCNLCPRGCGVNRLQTVGFCGCTDRPLVASICVHRGEEPVISGNTGICNVFFAHCNLRCIFCQNHQISRNSTSDAAWLVSYDQIVEQIVKILDSGVGALGFVSPTHQVFQMVQIVNRLHDLGYKPIIVYNSNGYDSVSTLQQLENVVDVYLPDFKYFDNSLALKCSFAVNYFDIASHAIAEMYRQKGASLITNADGVAEWGLIIRHLVLPGCAHDSTNLLRYIANEISPNVHVSLMSQYFPPAQLNLPGNLGRKLRHDEYQQVLEVYYQIGLRGWAQELDSAENYQPDFLNNEPFCEKSV